MKNNNKGAVELSLNLIIMLVIGLTVLGLVISFVTGFLGSAEDSLSGSLTQDDRDQINAVLRIDENFAFSPSTLKVIKGEETKLYVKVRNPTGDEVDVFSGGPIPKIATANKQLTLTIISASTGLSLPDGVEIVVQAPPIKLGAGEQQGYPLFVKASESLPAGNYFGNFEIELGDFGTGQKNTGRVTFEVE
jgi:hypothetical protein